MGLPVALLKRKNSNKECGLYFWGLMLFGFHESALIFSVEHPTKKNTPYKKTVCFFYLWAPVQSK